MTCSSCSSHVMHGGSLASERSMSYLDKPVSAYDFVPSSMDTPSPTSDLSAVALHKTTGGGRHRRSHRGGAGSDFVSTLYSRGNIIAPEAGVAELSKNFTSEGNLVPFKELVSPTNSPLLAQSGGRRSRRCRSSKKNKRVQRRSSQRSRRNRRSQRK